MPSPKSFLVTFFLLFSNLSFAQVDNSNLSGEVGLPNGIDIEIYKQFFLRTHSLSFDSHLSEMRRDGVTTKNYVAGFSTSGALLYEHEVDYNYPSLEAEAFGGDTWKKFSFAGRNAGFQILPYSLTIGGDGRVHVKAGLVQWVNMNAKTQDYDSINRRRSNASPDHYGVEDHSTPCNENYHSYRNRLGPAVCAFFKTVDKIYLMTYEYRKDAARDISFHKLDIGGADLKIAIAKGSGDLGKGFIGIKGGGSPLSVVWSEFGSAMEQLALPQGFLIGVRSEVNYGLEGHYETPSNLRFSVDANFLNGWEWYQGRNEGFRDEFVFSPSLTISKGFVLDNHPSRLGVKVQGNFIIRDQINGAINENLETRGQESLAEGSLFFNF